MAFDALSTLDREWLLNEWRSIPTEPRSRTPSAWAEDVRYLAESTMPGRYRFEVTPYLREIVDCMGMDSPVRHVSVMKGAQVGATSGILENALGYMVAEVGHAACMLVCADADQARTRLERFILPMLNQSGLADLIVSSDTGNARKSGKTSEKIEWVGGGYLTVYGAQNPAKLRSLPVQILLRDEIDAWPRAVGKDGDPVDLSMSRTATYESSRKILDLSTPLIRGDSKIESLFRRGDQRRYFVRCLKCNFAQTLHWQTPKDRDTGVVSGMDWQLDDAGHLVPGSVRYLCEKCQHPHTNDDKSRLLAPEHGAEWRPTAEPESAEHRSYHLSALYSPVGMQSWEACVLKWLEAWDPRTGQSKDNGKLQVFYNNVLAKTFEQRGTKLKFEMVSAHRRAAYRFGEVPNAFCTEFCGGPIRVLTCAVDVHKDNLAVAVFGWCTDRRAVLIDYWRFEGDTEQIDDAATWGRLDQVIDKIYTADDGTRYVIAFTAIDSGFATDVVYRFVSKFASQVVAIKGIPGPTVREFAKFKTAAVDGYGVSVDLYKTRWSSALNRQWDGIGLQPFGHFNAPTDVTDKQLRELTAESRREKKDLVTGRSQGFAWKRSGDNELWDLLLYNNAALDLLAKQLCDQLEQPTVDWTFFHEYVESRGLFRAA